MCVRVTSWFLQQVAYWTTAEKSVEVEEDGTGTGVFGQSFSDHVNMNSVRWRPLLTRLDTSVILSSVFSLPVKDELDV